MNRLRLALRRWFMADLPEPSSVFTGSMAFITLDLRPGDAVALMMEKTISMETANRIEGQWKAFWERSGKTAPQMIVFDGGAKLAAIPPPLTTPEDIQGFYAGVPIYQKRAP